VDSASAEETWHNLQLGKDSERIVTGVVMDHNPGGSIVNVEGVRGLVPLSQIVDLARGASDQAVEQKLSSLHGQTLALKIIEMDPRRQRLILSERAAAQERRVQQLERRLAELQPGDIRRGRVSSLTDFGAFVDLGGADGLIYLSELTFEPLDHPSQVLHVGQEVDARVLGVDRATRQIALSLKQVDTDTWSQPEPPPDPGPALGPESRSTRPDPGPPGSGGAGVHAWLPKMPIAPHDYAMASPEPDPEPD
jgi:small subunit ribosomal protein S1